MSLTIDYKWLRGTEDQGMHTHIDKLTVEPRKMNGLKNFVAHISNVNHWMMSHDNIWPALDPKHPLVTEARRSHRISSSKHEASSKRGSQDAGDAVRCCSCRLAKSMLPEAWLQLLCRGFEVTVGRNLLTASALSAGITHLA